MNRPAAIRSRRARIASAVVLLLFALYCAWFIYRTSFTIQGQRWFALFDDAMISMKYARNLASGHGLVWNPGGERVEGFTNPAWTCFMAVMHPLPIPPAKICAVVQVAGLLLMVVNLAVVRALAWRLSKSEGVALTAMLLTATYFPLNNWALQGMEVSLLAVWVTCGCWLLMRTLEERRSIVPLCVLLGAGTLIRIDAAVPALAMALLAAASAPGRAKRVAWALAIVGGAIGLQTLLRYIYYGELLPNTYFLKMAGFALPARLARGGTMLFDFIVAMGGVLCLPILLPFFRRDRRIHALLVVVAVELLYSVYVGGDAWEWYGGSNRFISIVMPVCMILLALVLDDIRRLVLRRLAGQAKLRRIAPAFAIAVVAGIALLLNLHGGVGASLRRWALVDRPLYIEENRRLVRLALRLAAITTPDATLAVVWAGSVPYFSQRNCVDLLGKNDRVVAHGPVRYELPPGVVQRLEPGHFKWDYRRSLGELQPDVIVDTWYGIESSDAWASYFAHDLGLLGRIYPRIDTAQLRLPAPALLASRLWWQGLSFERQERWDEAIECFRQAIETGEYNEEWRYHFGAVFVEHRPLEEVEAYYDSTVVSDPKPQTSDHLRGVALAQAGRLDQALIWFQRALEVDPAHEMSQLMWGNLLGLQQRYPEAEVHFREAIRISPDFSRAHELLAAVLRLQGKTDEARHHQELATRVRPDPARKFLHWGRYLLEHGRRDAAIAELERAVEADPDGREARRLLQRARRESP